MSCGFYANNFPSVVFYGGISRVVWISTLHSKEFSSFQTLKRELCFFLYHIKVLNIILKCNSPLLNDISKLYLHIYRYSGNSSAYRCLVCFVLFFGKPCLCLLTNGRLAWTYIYAYHMLAICVFFASVDVWGEEKHQISFSSCSHCKLDAQTRGRQADQGE